MAEHQSRNKKPNSIFRNIFVLVLILLGTILAFKNNDAKKDGKLENSIKPPDDVQPIISQNLSEYVILDDILTLSNHPKYMDSIVDAHNTWDGYGEGIILYPDSKYKEGDLDIITIKKTINNGDIISGLVISLDKLSKTYSLEDALTVAEEYFPSEEKAKYYDFIESYCVQYVDEPDKNEKIYICHYELNEEAQRMKKENEIDCVYSMYIYFFTNSNDASIINRFAISSDFSNTLFSSNIKKSGREIVTWSYDFKH